MGCLRLLVSTVNFGLGSAGKLASILAAVSPDVELVVHGSELGARVWSEAAQPIVRQGPTGSPVAELVDGVDVAVSILAPDVTEELLRIGVPTIYVDSLPFLWSDHDPVPLAATAYLAQQVLALPKRCWSVLGSIERLTWVEAVVPCGPEWTGESDRVIVNLGGVSSSVRPASEASYPAVVVPPTIEAVRRTRGDVPIVVTTSADAADVVRGSIPDFAGNVEVGALTQGRFLDLARSSSLLLTSPGLTTVLEGGALGIPTVVLPPQNLSQFHNARSFASLAPENAAAWPDACLRMDVVEEVAKDGEEAAVRYIYAQIDAALGDVGAAGRLTDAVAAAIASHRPTGPGELLLDLIGRNGAKQIAEVIDLVAAGRGPF